jgi:hypothetical protein
MPENELHKGQVPQWDFSSPYFRRAICEAHEENDEENSAMAALFDAVNDALVNLDAQFGTALDGSELVEQIRDEIVAHFRDQAEADDKEIAEIEKEEAEENAEEAAEELSAQETKGVQ